MGATAHDSRAGEQLGRYQLLEVVDSDGTCDAYRAADSQGSGEVTIRVLRPEFALQGNVVQSFVSGPRTLSGLTHPNVSRVLAVESDDTGIPYVVEERVSGQPLSEMLQAFPDGMPLGVAMNMLLPIVEAVDAAHAQGIVHGNLDSSRVLLALVDGSTVPKVIGFGAEGGAGRRPPEVTQGAAPDARADIWALGSLFYETLTGQAPQGSTGEAGQVELDELAPHLPASLSSLVSQCLMRDPAARVESDALCMQLQTLRKQLSGAGKPAASAARPAAKPATASAGKPRPKPKALRREPSVPFDPFAKRAMPSSAPPPANDTAKGGLPSMRPPPALGAAAAGKRGKSGPTKIDGLPSMRPPPVADAGAAPKAPKINTGFRERVPTPLPPPLPPPGFDRAPTDPKVQPPAAEASPATAVDDESSFADLSLAETAPGDAAAANDETSFAGLEADGDGETSFAGLEADGDGETSFAGLEADEGSADGADEGADDGPNFDMLESAFAALEGGDTVAQPAPSQGAPTDMALDETSFAGLEADDEPPPPPEAAGDTEVDPAFAATTMGNDATMMGKVEDVLGATLVQEDDDEPDIEYGDDDEVELTYDDDDDEDHEEVDEDEVESAPVEVKNLDALASAFGPLEGEDNVGQGESKEAKRARKFREEIGDETKKAIPGVFLERSKKAKQEEEERRKQAEDERKKKKRGAVLPGQPASPRDMRESVRRADGGVSAEQLAALRQVGGSDEESALKRMIGALILLIFAVGLLYMMPLLVDPSRAKAYEALGSRTKLFGAGISVLSVLSLVRLWALQLSTNPPLLRPVTMTLKVVTACICVIGISFFLPRGSLGPVEYGARTVLPWGAGLFYLFLGLYGLMAAMRHAAVNVVMAVLMGALYSGAIFGSYKVVMVTIVADILAERERKKELKDPDEHGELVDEDGQRADGDTGNLFKPGLDTKDLANKVKGENRDPNKGVRVGDRKLAGADEASDMEAIESMRKSRRKTAGDTDKIRDMVPDMMP